MEYTNISILDTGTCAKLTCDVITNGNPTYSHFKTIPYNVAQIEVVGDEVIVMVESNILVQSDYTNFVSPSGINAILVAEQLFNILFRKEGGLDSDVDDTNKLLSDIRNFNYNYLYKSFTEAQSTTLNLGETLAFSSKTWAGQFELIAYGMVDNSEKILSNIPVVDLLFLNTPPTSAQIIEIASDSADDYLGSPNGSSNVQIIGLDSGGLEISETVDLSGVTPVYTVNSYLRVNDMQAQGAVANAGNIYAKHPSPLQTVSYVPAGKCISRDGFVSIPSDKVFLMYQFGLECDSLTDLLTFELYIRPIGTLMNMNVHSLYRRSTTIITFDNFPATIPGGIDVMLTARHSGASGSHPASVICRGGRFDFNLYNALIPPAVDTSSTTPIAYPANGIVFDKNFSN